MCCLMCADFGLHGLAALLKMCADSDGVKVVRTEALTGSQAGERRIIAQLSQGFTSLGQAAEEQNPPRIT